MKPTYIDSVDTENKEAVMYLYGTIGEKVDGDLFARELASLDGHYDLVKLRLNGLGGSVIEGMSIVSAILSMNTPVYTYVDGVAASMLAVIALAGDRVFMYDFSKLMIHNPSFSGAGELSAKDRKTLGRMTDMLRELLSRRGNDETEIARLMEAETWFSAKEAMQFRLVDEVTPSGRKALLDGDPMQIVAQVCAEYQTNQIDMSKLTSEASGLLKLSADATEADVSAAVVALHGRAAAAEQKLAEKEKAEAEALKTEAKTLIREAVAAGRIDAAAEASYEKLFEKDHAAAKAVLAAIPKRESVQSRLAGAAAEKTRKLENMSWSELDRGGHLPELKINNRALFDQKFEAEFGHKPKNQ